MSEIFYPASAREAAELLAESNRRGLVVVPRGGGSKREWGDPLTRAVDRVISTANLNQVVEHVAADMTVTVEAGCTVATLQQTLAERGQRLAIDVLWPQRATIGGILATNDSGALRLRFGGLRDLIIGATVVLPDGTIASSGGKVVKNVAGYDLPKLMTGSFGTLGLITQAVFRLHPLPIASRTLTISPSDVDAAQRMMLAIQDSQLAHSALQLRVWQSRPPEVDVLLEGTEAGIEAQQRVIERIASSGAVRAIPDGSPVDTWQARELLWPADQGTSIAKFSVLPSQIADCANAIRGAAEDHWMIVVQATGIGYVKMRGAFTRLRAALEAKAGSLVLLTRSSSDGANIATMDGWGAAGSALPLMRAIKKQFDPNDILNPGRFVGGI